ncbi:hypothetical protein VCSRO103_3520 [Vibrio cholerae]|nr:hypothetical protein VCSRO103_3520 [Vibrio cholerae]
MRFLQHQKDFFHSLTKEAQHTWVLLHFCILWEAHRLSNTTMLTLALLYSFHSQTELLTYTQL